MPDPTLIVALRKKRLQRYSGEDSNGEENQGGDRLDELEARVQALEDKVGIKEGSNDGPKDGEKY